MGKIQNIVVAFSFPTEITNVFLPLDLSASKSGNDVMNKTRDESTPTTIPAKIGFIVISEV